MSHNHVHARPSAQHADRLRWALALTGAFMLVELFAAWLTRSLALLSDAAHMLTDVAALAIALVAIRIGRRPADYKRTFGYYRFEVLAAAVNAVLLFIVAAYIALEAWQRLRSPAEIATVPLLVVACIGLVVNFVSLTILAPASDESLNVKGAYLEVWSDMLGSAAVIVGAVLLWFTGWLWVDSAVAILIAAWVLPRTGRLLRESLNVLLQGVPQDIDIQAIESLLLGFEGVREVHALHVWSVTSGRHVMSAHLVVDPPLMSDAAFLARVNEELEHRHQLFHTTIQLESADEAPPHGAI